MGEEEASTGRGRSMDLEEDAVLEHGRGGSLNGKGTEHGFGGGCGDGFGSRAPVAANGGTEEREEGRAPGMDLMGAEEGERCGESQKGV